MKTIKCPICHSDSYFVSTIEGYLKGTFYDIYNCENCNCSHMDMSKIDKSIYDIIYNDSENVGGYNRYLFYSQEIKKQKNPLKWLSQTESIYSPIYDFLKGKKNLNVLEIGCGLGYTTYAVNKSGNSCVGFDLSQIAVQKATKQFGDFYYVGDVFEGNKITDIDKFDLIIATELIEHIDDFDKFFDGCLKHLKKGGSIILTTPNKEFGSKDNVWLCDLPPVHTILFSADTFKYIAKKNNLEISLYKHYKTKAENYLILKLFNLYKGKIVLQSKDTTKTDNNDIEAHLKKYSKPLHHRISFINMVSNYLCYFVFGKQKYNPGLGIVLTKK